jgi:hypothetical protein
MTKVNDQGIDGRLREFSHDVVGFSGESA